MKKYLLIVLFCLAFSMPAFSADKIMNARVALGTDISLGLGYGVGLRIFQPMGGNTLEFGPDFYYSKSKETTIESNEYTETTELTLFAVRVNRLVGYTPGKQGTFYIFGTGAAAVSVYWQEESPTDTSLGTPCCGGGSKHDAEGTGFAMIFNVGVGKALGGGRDVRLEFPILVSFAQYGGASSFIPTMTVSAGMNF